MKGGKGRDRALVIGGLPRCSPFVYLQETVPGATEDATQLDPDVGLDKREVF